jgi:5'-phosphate synthase pdxT subunit
MKIGVLALQGDFREHLIAAKQAGHAGLTVRRSEELAEVDALILPGGESTTIAQLTRTFDLFTDIQRRIAEGMPVYGSCAGMILLADRIVDGAVGQETFGGIDMTVRRNAFGRQVDSFESDLIPEDLVQITVLGYSHLYIDLEYCSQESCKKCSLKEMFHLLKIS